MQAITTTEELERVIIEKEYKFIGLFNQKDKQIIAFNSGSIVVAHRLKEICNALNGDTLPDGNYCIKGRNASRTSSYTEEVLFEKGDVSNITEVKIQEQQTTTTEATKQNILSYESVLELKVKLKEYELKEKQSLIDIQTLENTILIYEKEIEELEKELVDIEESQEQSLSDAPQTNVTEFIQNLSSSMLPMVERHYDIQERKIRLEEAHLAASMGHVQRQPSQVRQAAPAPVEETQKEFHYTEVDPEELTAEEYAQWLALFSQQDPEKYEVYIKENLQTPAQ